MRIPALEAGIGLGLSESAAVTGGFIDDHDVLEYFCRQHLRWPGLPLFITIIPGEPAADGLQGNRPSNFPLHD
jgi:hypothetical protein